MKVKAGRKKTGQKKQKKSSSLIKIENKECENYHEKKVNENDEKKEEQLDEETYKERLKAVYELIKSENYDKKLIKNLLIFMLIFQIIN